MSAVVIAEHPAKCPDCFAFIQPGDRITRHNVFADWSHEVCPKTRFDFDPAAVCPECFTVRAVNGKCTCPA